MILGLSIFDTVLYRLGQERSDAPGQSSAPWSGLRGFNASFVGAGSGPDGGQDSEQLNIAASAYEIDMFAPPPKPAPDVSMFKRLSPGEIARDINLQASDTPAELQLKRRKFARINHPDRAPENWRDAATTRMKIANLLIDEALKKHKAAHDQQDASPRSAP
ncbi:MAG: hypothetical protein Q8O63_15205 [Hoeflea sp.]|nr:hypothetical protein [Hoeflea sp.]